MELCAHFGFKATPFTRELPVKRQYRLPTIEEAIGGVRSCIDKRMSCAVIAPGGMGKTGVLRAVQAQLPEARYRVHYTKVTSLSRRDMCREIAAAVGLPPVGTYPTLVRKLQDHFCQTADTDGLRTVFMLDDAHEMRPEVLGLVRILTNFEMDSRLIVSLVVAGQLPLAKMLRRADLEDVARRLAYYAVLRPLSRDETAGYLEHRCTIAGARKAPFDQDAIEAVYEIGRGNMRTTDRVALRTLELACGQGCKVADSNHVTEARKQLWP